MYMIYTSIFENFSLFLINSLIISLYNLFKCNKITQSFTNNTTTYQRIHYITQVLLNRLKKLFNAMTYG